VGGVGRGCWGGLGGKGEGKGGGARRNDKTKQLLQIWGQVLGSNKQGGLYGGLGIALFWSVHEGLRPQCLEFFIIRTLGEINPS